MEIVAGKIMAGISKCFIILFFQVLLRPGLRIQNRRVETSIEKLLIKKQFQDEPTVYSYKVQSKVIYLSADESANLNLSADM